MPRYIENLDFFGSKQRITKSGEVFGKNLQEIGKTISSGKGLQLFTKQTGFKLFAEIVKNNPRLTGYSSNNWSIDETPTMPAPTEKVEGKQYGQAEIPKLKNSFTYYIKNPLPYISSLEAGWSKQAPTGFIANAIFFIAKQIRASK